MCFTEYTYTIWISASHNTEKTLFICERRSTEFLPSVRDYLPLKWIVLFNIWMIMCACGLWCNVLFDTRVSLITRVKIIRSVLDLWPHTCWLKTLIAFTHWGCKCTKHTLETHVSLGCLPLCSVNHINIQQPDSPSVNIVLFTCFYIPVSLVSERL